MNKETRLKKSTNLKDRITTKTISKSKPRKGLSTDASKYAPRPAPKRLERLNKIKINGDNRASKKEKNIATLKKTLLEESPSDLLITLDLGLKSVNQPFTLS